MEIKKYNLLPNPRPVVVKVNSATAELYVTITIGNGQIGSSKITNGTTALAKGDLSKQTFLGKASNLKNQTLQFRTNVLDVNQSTNKCVVSTKITDQNNTIVFAKTDNGTSPADGIASFVGNYIVQFS